MDLVEVDVVGAEPAQRGVGGRQHVLAREAGVAGSVRHRVEDLRRHDVLTRASRTARASSAPVTSSLAPRSYMSAVSKTVHPALDGAPHDRPRALKVEVPVPRAGVAVAHHPEHRVGDTTRPLVAEGRVLHRWVSFDGGFLWSVGGDARDHQREPDQVLAAGQLVKERDAASRGGDRKQREHEAVRRARQPDHGELVGEVGDHRRADADAEPPEQPGRVVEGGEGGADAERRRRDGADGHDEAEPVECGAAALRAARWRAGGRRARRA